MQSAGRWSTTVVTTTSSGPFGIGNTTSRVTYSGPESHRAEWWSTARFDTGDYDQANQYLKITGGEDRGPALSR